MMLHEAVMLEIYRQALNASELASPRCQSRDSNHSNIPGDARCPSNGSHCSGNEHVTPVGTPILPASPPVGLPLSATLPPAAAAALLPPQSAAVAAYLNAAAAAAQQNHLLLTNPLAAAASFVQQAAAQQAHSPNLNAKATPSASPIILDNTPALDFSRKSGRRESESGGSIADEDAGDENDARRKTPIANECSNDENATEDGEANAPLDLSVSSSRKRQADDDDVSIRKTPRSSDYKPLAPGSTWVPPLNPYLVAVAAASLSPKTPMSLDWTGKQKFSPNEATKALEKMTEMTRLGAATDSTDTLQQHNQRSHHNNNSSSNSTNHSGSGGRHSAWQSHWLTKGADAVKDVFKCVWCKQSFPTLASLTVHMKETQHCGVNMPPTGNSSSAAANAHHQAGAISSSTHNHSSRHPSTQPVSSSSSSSSSTSSLSSSLTAAAAATSNSTTERKSDLNLLIKETMPLPRKLVRGQDVWLGKGAEQTRQILKCMWCGQSFRSLAEMTTHMQETQHYTNIISQEQIISWKSTDDKSPNAPGVSHGGSGSAGPMAPNASSGNGNTPNGSSAISNVANQSSHAVSSNATVSAVLTCKVCDQAFATLKDLSTHMAKNAHYKEHLMRSGPTPVETTQSNSNLPPSRRGGRQTGGRGEKRKKSLPVRKLLELERAQQDYKNSNSSLDSALKPLRDFAASTKITCEKCGDKIETALFVEHIRMCLGGHIPMSPRNHNNNSISSIKYAFEEQRNQQRVQTPSNHSDGRQTADNTTDRNNISPMSSTTNSEILCPLPKEGEKTSTAPSVLNAIEQLIEKSFDTRTTRSGNSSSVGSKPTTPLGASILKRLGIDDNVDYTKPLMDPQTLHFLRSYSSYASRERSASESSSTSERCNSRLESVTPERSSIHSRQPTPRQMTPEKVPNLNGNESNNSLESSERNSAETPKIKKEPITETEENQPNEQPIESEKLESPRQRQKISVKKEFTMPNDDEDDKPLSRLTKASPVSRAMSPSLSERSITPKSNSSSHCSAIEKKPAPPSSAGSSLNALSSMFDNLNSMRSHPTLNSANNTPLMSGETNNNHNSSGKKSSANPLAALQKLCETTSEKTPPSSNTRNSNNVSSSSNTGSNTVGSGMVAFSWACNDAVMTSADSIIKCSFCDTPFCSKGAYRHHLSKVHFVKDVNDSNSGDVHSLKSSPALTTSPRSALNSPKRGNSKSPTVQRRPSLSPPSSTTPSSKSIAATMNSTPIINPYDESPQSKFLKYTELAKQLSSKNA